MKKQIRLFEAFAGIGSQLKALKNIENECNLEVISLGACDFYIDAIVAYMSIHYGYLKPETHYSKDEIIKLLSKYKINALYILFSSLINCFKLGFLIELRGN